MSLLLSTMNISQQGMNVSQVGLNVVSNNIANMNTEGYSKQKMIQAESPAYNKVLTASGFAKIGAGVIVAEIKSYRDNALDKSYCEQNSDLNYYQELADYATMLDDLFADDLNGEGLSGAFSSFFSAAEALNNDPTNQALRINFMEVAQDVCNAFNNTATSLDSFKKDIVGDINEFGSLENSKIGLATTEINSKLSELAELNKKILQTSASSSTPSGLLDQRSQILKELSSYSEFTTKTLSNGTTTVSLNGVTLVEGFEQVAKINVIAGDADNPAILQISDMDNNVLNGNENINDKIKKGKLGAYLELASPAINGMNLASVSAQINNLATEFAKAVNDIQTYKDTTNNVAAFAMDENNKLVPVGANDYIFLDENNSIANINAANIKINNDILNNPLLLATARAEYDPATNLPLDDNAISNNENIYAITQLTKNGLAGLNNLSVTDYLNKLITGVGSTADTLGDKANATQSTLDAINDKISNLTGVNIDEEIMDLIKYQKAYQYSARVFSATSEVLDTLLTLGQ